MKNKKRGFTLIELIVVMVLMAMLFAMGFSIYRFSTDAYAREASRGLTQSDLRVAMSVITKDMRKHPDFTISSNTITAGANTYTLDSQDLNVNGSLLISGIEAFSVSQSGKKITIKITSSKDNIGSPISYETTITRR